MNHLEIILKLLYKRVPIQAVLENKLLYNCFDRDTFMKMAVSYLPNYSENEAENILLYYIDTFRDKAHSKGHKASDELNVFDALFYYAGDCLTVQNNSVLCKYNRLVYWRQMTLELSEDLIVSAFLAQEHFHEEQVKERGFMWKRVIGHNNIQLNQILARGISENHFHLAGSSPIFHISWLSLMNNVTSSKLAEHLKQYDGSRRYTNRLYSNEYKEQSFYHRYLQAAFIRVLIYSKITNMRIHIGSYAITSQEAFRLLHIPEFHEGAAGKIRSIPKLYQAIQSSPKKEFYLQEVFCILFFEKTHYSITEEASLKDTLMENPFYNQLLFQKMAHYKLQKHVILQNLSLCLSFQEGITVKQFVKFLFFCMPKVDLDDILIQWTDRESYLKLWETITLKNALQLLHHPEVLENYTTELQATIDSFRFPPDKPISDDTQEIDYLLHQIKRSDIEKENPYFIFAGERWLLYTMLHQIYRNDSRYAGYYHLFYAYILIKESIRSEIIQSNSNVGFKNFENYQNRKLDLLKDAIYENASVKLALKECLLTENIRTLELRISPQSTTEKLRDQIMKLDNLIDPSSSFRHQFFYTLHFIKSSDKMAVSEAQITCRHYNKRETIRQQTMAIIHLREQFPEIAKRILGMDAASNEIGCRPQVFGQFFRQLKKHTSFYYETDGQHKLPQLRATYHVGEDFLDLSDGLRAIDEAILFLGLDCGTNPSSNYLIGTFRSYDRHPIIKFYNRGLTTDPEQLRNCPQISVSINTDDQGVFSTSLENEYALIACALEKVKDCQENSIYNRTMIYEWLDHIRIMGNEQSFGFSQYEKALSSTKY